MIAAGACERDGGPSDQETEAKTDGHAGRKVIDVAFGRRGWVIDCRGLVGNGQPDHFGSPDKIAIVAASAEFEGINCLVIESEEIRELGRIVMETSSDDCAVFSST